MYLFEGLYFQLIFFNVSPRLCLVECTLLTGSVKVCNVILQNLIFMSELSIEKQLFHLKVSYSKKTYQHKMGQPSWSLGHDPNFKPRKD